MATSQQPSQREDQSPQPSSPGYALEVVVDDETPGPSGLWVAPRLPPQAGVQKRKIDWSSESKEELQEDLPGLFDRVPELAPYFLPQSPVQKKQKKHSSESEAEQEGAPDSVPRGNPSLSPGSSGHKRKREWSSESEEDQEAGVPAFFDSALRHPPGSPRHKRRRECLSRLHEEPQEPSGLLGSEPSTHVGVTEKVCGLKRQMKKKHLSSVLPAHHAAFTRLLDDPVIKRFLAWDKNLRASDKYLLAMVIAYFSRAGLFPWQFRRIHFFLALYLANDMEEDNQAPKVDMFFFLYGRNFAQRPQFHKLRYQFIRCMGWALRVTPEECEEIQAYNPELWVWGRARSPTPGTQEP